LRTEHSYPKVLLTGGRAPATLELARVCARAGAWVYLAESQAYPLCKASACVKATYRVPSPRYAKEAFVASVVGIVKEQGIGCVIPTCEEIFYLVDAVETLKGMGCRVWLPEKDTLYGLHSKWACMQRLGSMGLKTPETYLVHHWDMLHTLPLQGQSWVFKPVYSRFASKTHVFKNVVSVHACFEAMACETVSEAYPWVVQRFVEGTEICTYGVALEGKLLAHSAYVHSYRAGKGAGICFTSIQDQDVCDWVAHVVQSTGYTGQVAFDLIRDAQGVLWPLECNPRATSGVHFLSEIPGFPDVFLHPEKRVHTLCVEKSKDKMLALAMCVYGLKDVHSAESLKKWCKAFYKASDVVWDVHDKHPLWYQCFSVAMLVGDALRKSIPLLEVSTYDIEWNGL
jgi:predicted ATP-grasp superfamily ATP-dependent carboligase